MISQVLTVNHRITWTQLKLRTAAQDSPRSKIGYVGVFLVQDRADYGQTAFVMEHCVLKKETF